MAKALFAEKELRDFVKNEALKTFNGDYDILYAIVQEEMLPTGKTFRETILPYFESEKTLVGIEGKLPLLTLMVPELPNNSFSAFSWDTSNPEQIPAVAVDTKSKKGISIYAGGPENAVEEFILPNTHVPAFAVVVVKDNERVTNRGKGNKSLAIKQGYEFTDESFNYAKVKKDQSEVSARRTRSIDQKVIDASRIGVEWHRDFIYYNLTPTTDRGPFSNEYKEFLTSFRFNTGDGLGIISDQGGDDPSVISGGSTGWTDGVFEFRVTALVNSTITGSDTYRIFTARGDQLFDIAYEQVVLTKICRCFGGCCTTYYAYVVKTITPKTLLLNKDVPLIAWDLYTYSFTMSVKFEEVDDPTTDTFTSSRSSSLASNFAIEGVLKKIGLKFGASGTVSNTQGYSKVVVRSSDDLAEDLVNFADKVIVGTSRDLFGRTTYITREYSTGLVSFSIEPLDVE